MNNRIRSAVNKEAHPLLIESQSQKQVRSSKSVFMNKLKVLSNEQQHSLADLADTKVDINIVADEKHKRIKSTASKMQANKPYIVAPREPVRQEPGQRLQL